jgi:hypothetical protein
MRYLLAFFDILRRLKNKQFLAGESSKAGRLDTAQE